MLTSPRTSALVLCYHRVEPHPKGPLAHLSVTPRQLESHLRQLTKRKLRFVDLTDLRRILLGEDQRGPAVCVTFDDGYLDNLEFAIPILDAFDCPATFFVVTERVGRTADWDPLLGDVPLMGWEDLRNIRRRGHDVGSHTRSHPWLTRVSAEALREELRSSREALENQLAQPCPALAYPYGDRNGGVVAAAAQTGYTMAFTVQVGFVGPHTLPLQIPRCLTYGSDGLRKFALKSRYGWRSVELAKAAAAAFT